MGDLTLIDDVLTDRIAFAGIADPRQSAGKGYRFAGVFPDACGVYAILVDGAPLYIGRATRGTIAGRLGEHLSGLGYFSGHILANDEQRERITEGQPTKNLWHWWTELLKPWL